MKKKQKDKPRIRKIPQKTERLESIEIKDSMFFVPDDFKKKFKGKGKWVLYVKKGLLVKLAKKSK